MAETEVVEEDDWDSEVNEQGQDIYNKSNFNTPVAKSTPLTSKRSVSATNDSSIDTNQLKVDLLAEQMTHIAMKQEAEEEEESHNVDRNYPDSVKNYEEKNKPAALLSPPTPSPSSTISPASERSLESVETEQKAAEQPSLRVTSVRKGHAFTEELEPEALAFFNELTQKKFSEQAIAFLNAYWKEIGDQAEFIFSVAWETIKYADMHTKGISYIHLYEEGDLLDFNVGLYFYEKLCKKVLSDPEGKRWREDPKYAISMPTMLTAIVRKKELREKVDCNFDGRVSFLEYLLYQYQEKTSPHDFTFRAMKHDVEEHPAITKARMALQDVNEAIRKYEEEKNRLETLAATPGVKGLGAKHQLAILHASPLAEQLNKSLITAEAAVRMATRKFASGKVNADSGEAQSMRPTEGSIWWLNRDLQAKKALYGRKDQK